ncbi:LOW QUALITY PROTEIN: structural maintenance of chromosomes protein 5-like [Pomacea canaliculata]|uniref:LOW QUALITY PROTEIN: structural maintenance of chromosomes protein 5-like n=1 Tax=Pomacea canaliculata TaxID=400727 RepID=UPI000D729C1D|nr:LOW QUALITY PROTEIN: structural maintenance of chromosomes protein 5-like [Pomacea canaliculata]
MSSSRLCSNKDRSRQSAFVEGAIVRIKLENILTYNSVEFKTGPYLNVIIGPNGTGKSAIVCAICLGLAGKTSWLGRAKEPADYVKYGTTKGTIELELFNCTGDNYVIRREITKSRDSRGTSGWWVNGRTASQKSVEEMVSRLKIQVGNLVQFLPQEKVADFARMSQQELLENTEKVVDSGDLYEKHQKLKEEGRLSTEFEQELVNLSAQLDTEQQKNARLEQDVINFKQREKFLEKVKLLKMKRPWLEYMGMKKEFERLKVQRDEKEVTFKKARSESAPLKDQQDILTQLKQNLDAQLKKKTSEIRDHANKVSDSSRGLENLEDKITEAKSDMEAKFNQEENRKKKLADLMSQKAALENELIQLEGASAEQLATELHKVTEQTRELLRELNNIEQQGMAVRAEIAGLRREINDAQTELRNIQDMGNRRLEMLRRAHKHTYDAVMWLRENKNKFKATVHEPILLCLNMKNSSDAKYLETHISFNDMRAFVCEDPADLELFMTVMRDQQKLKVNAVRVPREPLSAFRPRYPISELSALGFKNYLQDLFTCPEAVMRYLCSLYKVHLIPVGDAHAQQNVEQIIARHPELNNFYTAHVQYRIKKSKYDGVVSSRNTPLKEPTFLAASVDVQREHSLTTQIQETQKTLSEKENQYQFFQQNQINLEKSVNSLREKKKELMRQKDQKKRVQQQIQTKMESIQRVESEKLDLEAEKKMDSVISKIIAQKCDHMAVMHTHTQECFQLSQQKVRMNLKQAEIMRDLSVLEARLRDRSQGLLAQEKELEELKRSVKDMKAKAKEKLQEAKKATNTGSDEELSAEKRKAFDQCPSNIEDLDAEIHGIQARADAIFQTDEKVIHTYQQREKRIAELKATLEQKRREKGQHHEEVQTTHNQWLTMLKDHIKNINKNFSYFFSAMGCCGEVDLSIPESETAYGQYGVRIKVKFRDGEVLRELTPYHQSGGERSVATVLYMMSLQELAKCPFRCVDEINQGMDPVNERKIFELVVQTVCKSSMSQYFLLTPKLLPDLEYADNMTVLCVNNGPHVMNHSCWNIPKFLHRRAALEEEEN